MDVQLTKDQLTAQEMICEWFFNTDDRVFVLSGYAGTGKTFLIAQTVQKLGLEVGKEAVFVTPTGKAASVLIKNGVPAGTVHSLIYMRDEDDVEVDENGEILKNGRLRFIKRPSIDESVRLIVVDEASMIGDDVVHDLLSFGVKCLFCGDGAQLPPVGGECSLMSVPVVTLKEIVRQEKDNPIIRLATMARSGEYIPFGSYGGNVRVMSRATLSRAERKRLFLEADQIICGRNKTRVELNSEIRFYHGISSDEKLPLDGEKLVCTLNDWEKPLDEEGKFHLVNGVIGTCKCAREHLDMIGTMEFYPDFVDGKVVVPFDCGIFTGGEYAHYYGDKAVYFKDGSVAHENNFAMQRRLRVESEETICRFEFAYAITCHKAQGSEFPFVIVFDESWAFGEDRHRWLYTAITRAKKKLLILR